MTFVAVGVQRVEPDAVVEHEIAEQLPLVLGIGAVGPLGLGAVVDFGNVTINPVRFVTEIYAAGGKPYFDALAFHPYNYTLKFSSGMAVANSPVTQLIQMRQVMTSAVDNIVSVVSAKSRNRDHIASDQQYVAAARYPCRHLKHIGSM